MRETLRDLQRERRQLLLRMMKDHELAIGTVSEVLRKCGNPRCHCSEGLGHRQVIFLFKDKDGDRRRCKLVRRADEKRLIKAGKRYREFREDLKRLRTIDREEKEILMAIAYKRAICYE